MTRLIQLHAGPLSMLFDPHSAFLRHIKLGDREVVRAIFAAVRDRDWDTIEFELNDLQMENSGDGFELTFSADCVGLPFRWVGSITGTSDAVVEYRFSGEALDSFQKNRVGLCVLHPIAECAGQPCRVEHTDGTVTQGDFPRAISPHQPFKDIRCISHPVVEGVQASVTMTGEAFEMEDQRNWTDASFKTYSTPLVLPFPVDVDKGWQVDHVVTVDVKAEDAGSLTTTSRSGPENSVKVDVDWNQRRSRPNIGLSMATCPESPALETRQRLRELGCDHLRVDVNLDDGNWPVAVEHGVELARDLECGLEVAVFARTVTSPSWHEFLTRMEPSKTKISRWLVFHPDAKATPSQLADSSADALRGFDASIPIAVGTNAYFAELNRERPPVQENSRVCYSINPQVHAFDDLSLRETLEAQRHTVDSAHEIFARPVIVSPISLLPRFNPNQTSTEPDAAPPEPGTDHRQATDFAAAWTAGTLATLSVDSRVESLTLFEAHGPRGIVASDGQTYPIYDVLKNMMSAREVCPASCSHPLSVAAIGLETQLGERAVLLANMDEVQLTIEISDRSMAPFTLDGHATRMIRVE